MKTINLRHKDNIHTPSDSRSMSAILSTIRRTPDLSSQDPDKADADMRLLITRAQQGDRVAVNQIVLLNQRFVLAVANRYTSKHVPLEDLISEGNIGLLEAIQRYDVTRPERFISFAVWYIQRQISTAIATQTGIVQQPKYSTSLLREQYEPLLTGDPETDEHIRDAYIPATGRVRLDLPNAISGDALSDFLTDSAPAPDQNVSQQTDAACLRALLSAVTLPDRERQIIHLYYGIDCIPQSTQAIADQLHLTRERVRQLREAALRTIRATIPSSALQTLC